VTSQRTYIIYPSAYLYTLIPNVCLVLHVGLPDSCHSTVSTLWRWFIQERSRWICEKVNEEYLATHMALYFMDSPQTKLYSTIRPQSLNRSRAILLNPTNSRTIRHFQFRGVYLSHHMSFFLSLSRTHILSPTNT
jgi:hypothetical protein